MEIPVYSTTATRHRSRGGASSIITPPLTSGASDINIGMSILRLRCLFWDPGSRRHPVMAADGVSGNAPAAREGAARGIGARQRAGRVRPPELGRRKYREQLPGRSWQ